MTSLNELLEQYAKLTDDWLNANLTEYNSYTAKLTEGMRYSVLSGGKRIRPALMFASASVFFDDIESVIPFAGSIEVLHAYSLIHDDLPAMDDDDLRRGKPTNHIKYGYAEAILAGDALLTKAFEFISDRAFTPDLCDKVRLDAVNLLSIAAGDKGMVAGQYLDIISDDGASNLEELEFIHLHKTAALIKYSSSMGAVLANKRGSEDYDRLMKYGENIGLAFQIADDILDITSTEEVLGKKIGSDEANSKITYPVIYGVDKSKTIAQQLVDEAVELVQVYGEKSNTLVDIANMVIERKS